jgi:mono/diheme cytochrome c family protein
MRSNSILLAGLLASCPLAPALCQDAAPRPAALIAQELCAGCHGANLAGGSAPNLLDGTWLHGSTEAEILKSIREGFPQQGLPEISRTGTLWEATVDPVFDRLRAEPRFVALLADLARYEAAERARIDELRDRGLIPRRG